MCNSLHILSKLHRFGGMRPRKGSPSPAGLCRQVHDLLETFKWRPSNREAPPAVSSRRLLRLLFWNAEIS
jgi:hypothetical protein